MVGLTFWIATCAVITPLAIAMVVQRIYLDGTKASLGVAFALEGRPYVKGCESQHALESRVP